MANVCKYKHRSLHIDLDMGGLNRMFHVILAEQQVHMFVSCILRTWARPAGLQHYLYCRQDQRQEVRFRSGETIGFLSEFCPLTCPDRDLGLITYHTVSNETAAQTQRHASWWRKKEFHLFRKRRWENAPRQRQIKDTYQPWLQQLEAVRPIFLHLSVSKWQ